MLFGGSGHGIVVPKEDCVSDLQQKLQADILGRLKRRKDQRLIRRDFDTAAEAIKKQFSTDSTAIEQAVEALLREQYVSRTAHGAYQLEQKGADYLAQTVPAPATVGPELNENLLPYQKAFGLMQLFCAKDKKGQQSMTRSELRRKLGSETAKKGLLFARMSSDPIVNPDHLMMDWIVQQLVQQGDIDGKRSRYTLNERGKELLAATDQYDSESIKFQLTGKQLNALREAIRDASAVAPPKQEPREQPAPIMTSVSPQSQPSLTEAAVLEAFETLRRERFARNGIVPVFELRRLLIARHGTEAVSHATLDPLLKQMRREKRLRMIAIGDLSEATTDQLDDSLPGENETFFYIEAAHESAHV